jgi:hypothetical protein
MGTHYLDDAYAKDPSIRAAKPELPLYVPQANRPLKLVAQSDGAPTAGLHRFPAGMRS